MQFVTMLTDPWFLERMTVYAGHAILVAGQGRMLWLADCGRSWFRH
jgi:hypothetical protein